ncbi:MAG: hypothetical protein CV088_19910 [Nitrospira sp. LK70]|nr:hypothetical protein [Nitrospira sp. LK70]
MLEIVRESDDVAGSNSLDGIFQFVGGASRVAACAAVSGFYFAYPDAKYFAVGKIGKDQVEDYATRKGMDLRTVERWLSPNLNYEPQ